MSTPRCVIVHVCMLHRYCQLGHGDAANVFLPTPVRLDAMRPVLPPRTKAVAVACGAWHTLGLFANGRVGGWGRSALGQLHMIQTDKIMVPCPTLAVLMVRRHDAKFTHEKFP